MLGLGIGITSAVLRQSLTPARLFADGSNGLLQDYSATTGLYSDNLGATPLTTPDTGVGLVADRSRVRSPVTAYGGAQASAGFKPKWGRAPVSRRNLLARTQEFNDAVWTKTRTTVIANAITAPDGSLTADKIVETATTGAHYLHQVGIITGTYCTSAYLKAGERSIAVLQVGSGTLGIAYFDLVVGTVSNVTAGYTTTMANVGGGWWRCSISGIVTSPTGAAAAVYTATVAGSLSYAGDGTSGLYVWGVQVESGATATVYQTVTSTYDMTEAGVPSYGYIRPDRTDDVLTTTLTLAQTGDVAVFGRTGSKIESGLIYGAGATFSLGATTVTGMSAGVLAAVGDVVGVLAIGRALTTAEKASTLAYFQARGAGAWL